MSDRFPHDESLEGPPKFGFAATPSDGVDLPNFSRGINVAEAGTVRVTTAGGDDVTLSVVAGVAFPIRAQRIWATGTSATGIVVLY